MRGHLCGISRETSISVLTVWYCQQKSSYVCLESLHWGDMGASTSSFSHFRSQSARHHTLIRQYLLDNGKFQSMAHAQDAMAIIETRADCCSKMVGDARRMSSPSTCHSAWCLIDMFATEDTRRIMWPLLVGSGRHSALVTFVTVCCRERGGRCVGMFSLLYSGMKFSYGETRCDCLSHVS